MSFAGKVVVVTGSSSGIGADAAVAFAKEGAQLVITGRNEERLCEVAKRVVEASPDGLEPLQVIGDVNEDVDCKNLIEKTIDSFSKLDVLVNNAGSFANTNILDEDFLQGVDAMMKNNFRSMIVLTHYAIPHLIISKGNVVSVSSCAALDPLPGVLGYNCAKAAVDMATKSLVIELSRKGVRFNTINPGIVATPLVAGLGEATVEGIGRMKYPIARSGQVADTTNAILFLASERSSFLTGVLLPVDGGLGNTTSMYQEN